VNRVPGAGRVRAEDAFDAAAIGEWLRANAADATGLDGIPEVAQFTGGASNLTYLLRFPGRDLVLRRPPSGTKARSAHDMRREHDLQLRLRPAYPYVPEMIGYCADEAVIGSEFYVAARIVGTILRRDIPSELGLVEADVRRLAQTYVERLVELHSVDVTAAGLTDLAKGPGYVARQVGGWSERYRRARTPDLPDGERVMAWLAAEQPDDVRTCLIHNDFRLDNMVLAPDDPTRVIGVLDWEMATVGDPLMDLGGALAYWVQADDDPTFLSFRRQPTNAPGMPSRDEIVARYLDHAGLSLTSAQWRFYEVFGLFRLAVIVAQIYHRYYHRQTTNRAFAGFGGAARMLDARAQELLDRMG
jgi:aminoglycoside phosphotransferase (APT) family kinase protein